MAVVDVDFVLHVQLRHPSHHQIGIGERTIAAKQLAEQMKIGEHTGKILAVSAAIVFVYGHAIDADVAAVRQIQAA